MTDNTPNSQSKVKTEQKKVELCRTCKSFYGNQSFDWQCSTCYNKGKKLNKVQTAPIKKQSEKTQAKQQQQKKQVIPPRPVQQNKNRCYTCRKKTGLLGVQCKCGYFFCNSHRLPEDHECDYNHQEHGKEKLKKEIIKITHQKIAEV